MIINTYTVFFSDRLFSENIFLPVFFLKAGKAFLLPFGYKGG